MTKKEEREEDTEVFLKPSGPFVGLTVHFRPAKNLPPIPAIVTRVHDIRTVNLKVFQDSLVDVEVFAVQVRKLNPDEEFYPNWDDINAEPKQSV